MTGAAAEELAGRTFVVVGIRAAGIAVGAALLENGARVIAVDRADDEEVRGRAQVLEILGASLQLGDGDTLPEDVDVVVVSPGVPPHAPIVRAAGDRGIPVWSEVELAWRVRPADAAPWLCLTGTNGKTTTVEMLASMLRAGGLRAVAAGNVGLPLADAVRADPPFDVLAVELSSFQLEFTHTVAPLASAVLNVAEDHVDWHGSLEAYVAAKGRVYERTQVACVYNVADPATERLVREAEVEEGCRAIGFTMGVPSVGMVGVVDDVLVDRAFVAERDTSAAELATLADVRPPAPHNVANALAAAALARAVGVDARAVREGLRAFVPGGHRITEVGRVAGVTYVDDSKATNPHAAASSLSAFDHVVWVAGGLAKGATFDGLVEAQRARLRGAVLIGADRGVIAAALARHAPDVPVVELASTDTEVMVEVVRAAAGLAEPGDTVLLAPACASMDIFRSYAERGDTFATAVTALAEAGDRGAGR